MLFKHAGVTLVCEHQTTSLVKMIPGLNVIEYDLDSSKTFARQFTGLAKEFRGLSISVFCWIISLICLCFILPEHRRHLRGLAIMAREISFPQSSGESFKTQKVHTGFKLFDF